MFLPTESDYLKLFASANPKQHIVLAEGSTTYLQSHVAIENILRFNPDARFLVMLRNPVDVAHGMHAELLRHFLEDVTDFEAASALQARRTSKWKFTSTQSSISTSSCSMEEWRHLPRNWTVSSNLFQRRDAKLLSSMTSLTASSCRATFDFLGLSHDGRTEFPKVNEARKYRLGWMGRLYHDPAPIEVPMR